MQTTPTAPTSASAKHSSTQTCKPEGAHASKSLCTPSRSASFRTKRPPPASRRSCGRFPSTKKAKKSTASSWSNRPASNGKTLPPSWTGASFSQTDRKATSLPRGTLTQRQTESRGSRCAPNPAKVEDPAKWEKAVLWAVGAFGFWSCPIFRVDILTADGEGVELRSLRCYTKDANARTILAASKRPTKLHPNGGLLSALLPPTDKIVWEWRGKKCHAIGNDSSKYKLQEVPEIAEKRKISALSTRN